MDALKTKASRRYPVTPVEWSDTVTLLTGVLDMSPIPVIRAMILTLALAAPATEQPSGSKLPDTAPGRLMGEWLTMCAAPRAEQFAKWDAEHYSDRIF